jgi:serine/threonine-protein kinase RsbT
VRIVSAERIPILEESDIVVARQRAGQLAKKIGMGLVDQTKIATATSELARNIIRYAKTGEVVIEEIDNDITLGLQLTFKDKGPGIADIAAAMRDGFTTSKGMGLGLSGSKRLVNEFDIESEVGVGTTIILKKWKRI